MKTVTSASQTDLRGAFDYLLVALLIIALVALGSYEAYKAATGGGGFLFS